MPVVPGRAPERKANWSTNEFLETLKLHISHAAGGSAVLLPFALSQVGVYSFLFLLLVHACCTGASQIIGYSMILQYQKKNKERNRNAGQAPTDERNDGTWSNLLITWFVKLLFALDVQCCIAFYYLIIEEILMKLVMLVEENDIQKEWGLEMLISVVISLVMLLGIAFKESQLHEADAKHPTNGGSTGQQHYAYCSIVGMCLGLPKPGAEIRTRTRYFETERNLQFAFYTLLFAMVMSTPAAWAHTFDKILDFKIEFVPMIYANTIIMFCFKSYHVLISVDEDQNSNPGNDAELKLEKRDYILIYGGQAVLAVVYFVFAVFAVHGIDGDVNIVFVTGYGHNLAGYVLSFLCLLYVLFALFIRFALYCKHVQRLLSGLQDVDTFRPFLLFTVFCSLFLKRLFFHILPIVFVTGLVTNNVMKNIIPVVSWYSSGEENRNVKYQAIALFMISVLVLIAPICLMI